MTQLTANYRQVMAYQIYFAVGFVVAPFSFLDLWRGHYLVAIPPLVTGVLCLINVVSFRRSKRFYVARALISFLYILNLGIIVQQVGAAGTFWAFPTLLALYWVHERRVAQYLVAFFFLVVCASAFVTLSLETTLRFAATLVTTAVFFNIASRILEQHYDELRELSLTDHLTGAYNRRYMDGKIDEMIERHRRQASEASLITLDIDHFKKINDDFGHSVGDRVLVKIVELIKSRVRVLDTVCRSGGEEFVVILPDTPEEQARALGEELRHSIGDSPVLKNYRVTVSCGVSGLMPGDSRDSWLHRCDQALYTAKRSGRNAVAVTESRADEAGPMQNGDGLVQA